MGFKVSVAPSGAAFEAQAGESVLEAASRAGITLDYGCRNGLCGSCLGEVLDGEVVYPDGRPKGIDEDQVKAGKALFCKAQAVSDLRIKAKVLPAVAGIEVRTLPCRVQQIDHLAEDVIRLFLKLPKDDALKYLPGQYIEFLLKNGKRRAFSIANADWQSGVIELHIRHVAGGEFTDWAFSALKEKTILRIQGPLGTFRLHADDACPMIMLGGGTGFAPLKAVIEQVFDEGIEQPLHLFWGVRSKADLYLPSLPQQWAAERPNFHFTPVLSEPREEDGWDGETGFVHQAVLRAYPELAGFSAYMCGPPIMISSAQQAFVDVGLDADKIYYDSFDYAAASESSADAGA